MRERRNPCRQEWVKATEESCFEYPRGNLRRADQGSCGNGLNRCRAKRSMVRPTRGPSNPDIDSEIENAAKIQVVETPVSRAILSAMIAGSSTPRPASG